MHGSIPHPWLIYLNGTISTPEAQTCSTRVADTAITRNFLANFLGFLRFCAGISLNLDPFKTSNA